VLSYIPRTVYIALTPTRIRVSHYYNSLFTQMLVKIAEWLFRERSFVHAVLCDIFTFGCRHSFIDTVYRLALIYSYLLMFNRSSSAKARSSSPKALIWCALINPIRLFNRAY